MPRGQAKGGDQMHYVLSYDYVDNMAQRRGPFREAHLTAAKASADRGELVLAGGVGEPVEGALLVFRTEGPSIVEAFVKHDPYVVAGLVKVWSIRPFTVVVGGGPDK